MGGMRFEQSVMGASVYYNGKLLCHVSGMEEAERLTRLFSNERERADNMKSALAELVDAVKSMDINKQKEVIRFAKKLLEKNPDCG